MFNRIKSGPGQEQAASVHQQQFRKLCQLCSPNFSKEEVLASEIDWPAIWKLALRHRVVSVMAERIKQLEIAVPAKFEQLIAANVQQNLYKGMRQAAELVRLTKLFEAHDIPFVVFKGIALLKLLGLELHQRHHGDIDILLADVEDVWRADEVLRGMGYQRQTLSRGFKLNAPQKEFFKKYEKDVTYFHPDRAIQLELHFKLCLSRKLLPITSDEFYRQRTTVDISGVTVPVMSQVDHQLYLLVHGAISRWFRLKWLCDVPLAGNNGASYQLEAFLDRASQLEVERMTTLGLFLANELLSMPVSANVIQHKNQNKGIKLALKIALDNIFQDAYENKSIVGKTKFWVAFSLVYMPLLRKDFSYKLDHFRSYFSRISDWEVLPLPASMFFLYYPLRPFLWLKRQLAP